MVATVFQQRKRTRILWPVSPLVIFVVLCSRSGWPKGGILADPLSLAGYLALLLLGLSYAVFTYVAATRQATGPNTWAAQLLRLHRAVHKVRDRYFLHASQRMRHGYERSAIRPLSSAAKSDRLIVVFLTASFATSVFFLAFPEVDLAVSRWFFNHRDGFVLSKNTFLLWLRTSSDWSLSAIITLISFRLLRDGINGALTWPRVRKPIWLLSGLALGPGLIVNGLLKAHWGRPRPIEIDVFGGEAVHQTVWVISDWCDRNCSFVSGEASLAAWLVAAALITPKPVRLAATAATLVYAGSLSLNRIAFGGHFLSDVVLAWLICGLVFAILHRLIPGR